MLKTCFIAFFLSLIIFPKSGAGIDYNYTDSLESIVSANDDDHILSDAHLSLARAYQKDSSKKSEKHYLAHLKHAKKINDISYLYAL